VGLLRRLPIGLDEGDSSWLADGTNVSAETSRRLACDSARMVMQNATDSRGLDAGRRTRAAPCRED
jgi:hypothetical protein